MDFQEIQKLMDDFEDSNTRELKIDNGDFHLYLSKNKHAHAASQPQAAVPQPAANPQPAEKEQTAVPAGRVIKAPLVGTVYLQAKPDADPYVKVGTHVNKGDVVCVIEAMKMMTEIKSEYTGTISKVHVTNEELVEVEQPLFTVTED